MKYRGEIGIELENIGTEPFVLKKGAKVAQLVLCPVLEAVPQEVDELDETTRGADGYGSTGTMTDIAMYSVMAVVINDIYNLSI